MSANESANLNTRGVSTPGDKHALDLSAIWAVPLTAGAEAGFAGTEAGFGGKGVSGQVPASIASSSVKAVLGMGTNSSSIQVTGDLADPGIGGANARVATLAVDTNNAGFVGLGSQADPASLNHTALALPSTALGASMAATDAAGSSPSNDPGTSAGLHINLIQDANNVNAPAGWFAAIRQAADIIEQNFSDPVTINLRVGYASFRGVVDSSLNGSGGAYANTDAGTTGNYNTVAGWLLGDRTTTDDINSYNALPNSSSSFPGGANNFYVPNAELRALGQLANNSTIDGSAAFGTGISNYNLVAVALHELTHAMGRISLHYTPGGLPVIADWFRFDGPGHFQWTEGSSTASPSYYSIDNGATRIADFGQTSDYSDYLNGGVQGGNDPFNEFYSGSTYHSLTTADLRELDTIGFNRVDDFVQNQTTTGAVSVNSTATGTITPGGDHDWFRVNLTAGVHYRFDALGSPTSNGTLPDSTVALYDSAGTQLGFNDDSGVNLNGRLFYTPTSSGTYYEDVGAFSGNTGTYTVAATIDDFDNTFRTTGAVAVGGTANGNIETISDHDWFRVSLTAGVHYQLDERGSPSSGGTLADSFLTLHDSSGAQIASNDDGGLGLDSRILFTPTTTGTYYLDAGAFSSNTGTYTVDVSAHNQFATPSYVLDAFGQDPAHGGWSNQNTYPREMADVNGDGRADVVAFGENGVSVSLATGGGNFAAQTLVLNEFGHGASAGGWTDENTYHRQMADVDGDGRADIVGFGENGVIVSLATGGGNFAAPTLVLNQFGHGASAGGWTDENTYHRELADVNGDGRADIVGFGEYGVYVSLATSGGNFAAPTLVLNQFGHGDSAGGWTDLNTYPRELADVNGDGRADIVGFGESGVYVALATSGGNFAAPTLVLNDFGHGASAGGWTSLNTYPRELGDVNGDGRADIVGFGENGALVALATGNGNFAPATVELSNFGHGASAGGWTSEIVYPRLIADVNGDHAADIVGFGANGVYTALSDYHLLA